MSPIHGLTDTPPAFIKLGRIKKGDKGGRNGAPRDLDHFRVTFQVGPISELLEKKFREIYGNEPKEINVRFPSADPADVWDANYECYKKGGLIAKAAVGVNGPYWIYYRHPETSKVLVRNGTPVGSEGREFFNKPIDLESPIYFSADKKPNYLQTYGRLQVVIPEFTSVEREGKKQAVVGFFEFCPKSPRDIRNISGELAMYDAFAKAAGKTINGVPFKIIRRLEDVTKKIDGKLVMDKSWVCHLDCTGEWGRLALEAAERLALPDVVDAEYYEEDDDFGDPEPVSRNAPQPTAQVDTKELVEARQILVKTKDGEKFVGQLTPDQLNYMIKNGKNKEQVAAARLVLTHDHAEAV